MYRLNPPIDSLSAHTPGNLPSTRKKFQGLARGRGGGDWAQVELIDALPVTTLGCQSWTPNNFLELKEINENSRKKLTMGKG